MARQLLKSELATLLTDLLAGQDELLAHPGQEAATAPGCRRPSKAWRPSPRQEEERLLGTSARSASQRREQLLGRAADEGLPSASIAALADALPSPRAATAHAADRAGRCRARLLQHQSLVNWVIVQRTLIHLSQLLEIIATGGRLQPTYGEGKQSQASGALVDRAA